MVEGTNNSRDKNVSMKVDDRSNVESVVFVEIFSFKSKLLLLTLLNDDDE